MANWEPRDELATEAVAGLLADTMPEQCNDCGGMKTDDTTPARFFKAHEICECPTDEHLHIWDNYVHTIYVLVRTPLEHHCRVCSTCNKLFCETT